MQIRTNCKNIQDFCQSVDKALGDSEFTYISVKDGQLLIYAQSTFGTVYYSTSVEAEDNISAGVFTKNFVDTFKKLYGEEVNLTFKEKTVQVQKDNIKVGLPIVSGVVDFHFPRYKVLECDTTILTEHLIKSVEVLDKTGFVGAKNPCVFVDNSKELGTYVCRFSDWAFRIAKMDKINSEIPLFCVPDNLAKVVKLFKGTSYTYIYSKNKIGCTFENGITVFLSQVGIDPPVSDIFAFGVDSEIQSSVQTLVFNRETLHQAVDTVSSILGDTEGFVEFEPVGRNSEGLIWEVRGKTSIGLTASEKVVGAFVEGFDIEGFGVSKKILGKVLKNSNDSEVRLADLNSSLLGVFIDDKVVYLMSKIHRG